MSRVRAFVLSPKWDSPGIPASCRGWRSGPKWVSVLPPFLPYLHNFISSLPSIHIPPPPPPYVCLSGGLLPHGRVFWTGAGALRVVSQFPADFPSERVREAIFCSCHKAKVHWPFPKPEMKRSMFWRVRNFQIANESCHLPGLSLRGHATITIHHHHPNLNCLSMRETDEWVCKVQRELETRFGFCLT